LDPSEIELDQRSAGMQYFFSFYLIFQVESDNLHRNSILLFDEPGLHVHGTAQLKSVKFLEKLSKDNQLLYTTHSPFMIDGDHLDRVRIVYEDPADGSTRVSEDVWPKDSDSLFPLQAGLGYSIAQTLFYSKRQLVVEGLTDYTLLKTMDELRSEKGITSLRKDAVITPSGGVSKLMPLASMLLGNEVKIVCLLDGDVQGLQKGKDIKSKLLVNCIYVSDIAEKEGAEIEDLFDESLYLEAVKSAYPEIKLQFTPEEKQIKSITQRLESLFRRNDAGIFEKRKPVQALRDIILEHPEKISEETNDRFKHIFEQANQLLENMP
jgi:predicted ATP-dependent endonuclease of OLD family